jgi:hypothetical protein
MIGQFGINCCPALDNFGKKDGGVVLAVYGYSALGIFFYPACISRSWLAAMPTGRHSPVPQQL